MTIRRFQSLRFGTGTTICRTSTIVDHAAPTIELNHTAVVEHLIELLAPSLYPRLHTRQRNASLFGGRLLRQSLEFHQGDRLPIVS